MPDGRGRPLRLILLGGRKPDGLAMPFIDFGVESELVTGIGSGGDNCCVTSESCVSGLVYRLPLELPDDKLCE